MSDEITKTENSDEISKSGVGEATSEVVNAAVTAPDSYVHGTGPDGQGDIGGGNWATIPNWTDGHASGVHASGGVGRVNDGNATDYGNLGRSDRLNLGILTTLSSSHYQTVAVQHQSCPQVSSVVAS